jgi:acyl-CoA thioester hydrolase
MAGDFVYSHRVQFYETDLMAIVHHSNYVRMCEEARVAWAHHHGLMDYQKKEAAAHFAVIEVQVKYLKPCFFGDQVEIQVQGKMSGVRIFFQYKLIAVNRGRELVALAKTSHAPLDENLKVMRPLDEMKTVFAKEGQKWTETWL